MASAVEPHSEPTPSGALARFIADVSFDDIPEDAVRLAERCFVDTVGVAVAGATAEAGRTAAAAFLAQYDDGPATVYGRDRSLPVPEAAFVNGTASHALDYDDVSSGMDGHPSPPLVAPILALGESLGASGKDLLTAYVTGFETECYVAAPNRRGRTGPGLHTRGWHPTAVFGTFGAAAGAAHLLGLDTRRARHAINIAASMPAGLKRNFGSLSKPMHAGQAAAAGIRAALLAEQGFTAIDDALETGFYPVYAGVDELDPGKFPALGAEWAILEEGVDIKKYPSCYATHTTISAASQLATAHEIEPADIERVHVDINPLMQELLVHDDPTTEAQAKFSVPYATAAAIVFDYIGIASFEPDAIQNPDLQRVRERVTYTLNPDLPADYREATVTIDTVDGDAFSVTVDEPPATHENPLSDDDLRAKFMECATRTIPEPKAERAYEALDSLRGVDDLDPLLETLTA